MKNLSGKVYDIDTKDGIKNISVTDGRNVVKTQSDGSFILPGWERGHFVTVTVPSGYRADNFYLKIDSSIESYDFYLKKDESLRQTSYNFIHISDTEIGKNSKTDWIKPIKKIIKDKRAAFLIHTGDICYEDGLKRHKGEMNSDNMGCPVYYTIGNHDYVDGNFGEELYESIYGPVWYSFEVGDVHYAVTPIQYGDSESMYTLYDRWTWLKNDLENTDPEKRLVIFNHTKSPTQDYVLPLKFGSLDLKKYNLKAWIFGHYHYNYLSKTYGVLNISTARPDCGGIDSSVIGARLIGVTPENLKTKLLYIENVPSSSPRGEAWSTRLLGNVLFCDTLLDDGNVYTATVSDGSPSECGIFCLSAKSGKIKWLFKTSNSVRNNLKIMGENIVALDTDGRVYCLNKETGKLVWSQQIDLGVALGTSSGIAETDGKIIAGTSRQITALNADNGHVIWSNNLDKGENSPAEFVTDGERILVSSHWASLDCLSLKNGSEIWKNNDKDLRFRSSTPLFIDSKTILAADNRAIMLIDAVSGTIESKKTFDDILFSSSAAPAYKDGVAYVPTSDSGLAAYSFAERRLLWKFKTGENIIFTAPYTHSDARTVESTPIIEGDTIYFGANDGKVYALDIHSAEVKKTYVLGSSVLGKISMDENYIYACSFNGYAAAFKK